MPYSHSHWIQQRIVSVAPKLMCIYSASFAFWLLLLDY